MSSDTQRSSAIWSDFCAELATAGQVLTGAEVPVTPLEQAEGLRYLSRLTRTALHMLVDAADPDFPRLFQLTDETLKIGADNPDNLYLQAVIAGDREYRLRGVRGTVPYVSLGTKADRYATDGTMVSTGELESADMEIEADGSFQIELSRERKGRNWLPMQSDSTLLIIRQTFEDRSRTTPAQFTIECIDGPPHPRPLDVERIEGQLRRTAAWVRGTAATFADWTRNFMTHPNEILERDQAFFQRAGGDPRIWYGHGYFDLAPDEAWVIETEMPENVRFWNFQLNNWWMESLDYVHHRVWINGANARLEDDGRLILVAAPRDPGFGNWIDTAGHCRGTALLRWIDANRHPVPRCRVIKHRDPKDSSTSSAA